MQPTCGIICAIEWANSEDAKTHVEKVKRADTRTLKKARNEIDRSHWVKALDQIFNRFIRLRDAGQSCISCQGTTGQMQAGHYKPKGSNGNLRWDESNVHAQCATCNNFRSGNLTEYRISLLDKVGKEAVEYLEGPHAIKKITISEMKELVKVYKAKVKLIEDTQ
jgi:5-methylcytosine-specific restriction endonuclease McrA